MTTTSCHKNSTTDILAETLASHIEVWDLLVKANALPGAGPASPSAFREAVSPYVRAHRKLFLGEGANLSEIDWGALAELFPAEDSPYSSAKTETLAEAPAPSSNISSLMRPVPADALRVLRASIVEGNVLKLPAGRLDRALYESINGVLGSLGGKWVGRKIQGHVFAAHELLALHGAIDSGHFLNPKDVGFFPTPDDLADDLASDAQIRRGMTVLEPSGGEGALALRAAKWSGSMDNVTVCELLESNVRKLREMGFKNVHQQDFLTFDTSQRFDRIIMNPPFSNGADIDHFMHAARLLEPDGRIAAIMSPSWQNNTNKKAVAFRELMEECGAYVEPISAGTFKSSGTMVATVKLIVEAESLPWNHSFRDNDREMERERA